MFLYRADRKRKFIIAPRKKIYLNCVRHSNFNASILAVPCSLGNHDFSVLVFKLQFSF